MSPAEYELRCRLAAFKRQHDDIRAQIQSIDERLVVFVDGHKPPYLLVQKQKLQDLIRAIERQARDFDIDVQQNGVASLAPLKPKEAQDRCDQLPLNYIPSVSPLPPCSRMPHAPHSQFVGRENEFLILARRLKARCATVVLCDTDSTTGIGGIGKTQLAAEFVHRYGHYFAGGVFWLSFATPESIKLEVAACGYTMNLSPHYADLKINEQVNLVQQVWLQSIPRLLVFDDCEDEKLLHPWRPLFGGCRVLVTSRRPLWNPPVSVRQVSLKVLHPAESVQLLRQFRPDLTDSDADDIAANLDHLPLSLHLAAHFLARNQHGITPAAYLAQLRRPHFISLSSHITGGISLTAQAQHVARIFTLSLQCLDTEDPTDALALSLLARAACFAPSQNIPRAYLLATAESNSNGNEGETNKSNSGNLGRFRIRSKANPQQENISAVVALARIFNLGLLESETGAELCMHPVLAALVQTERANAEAQSAVEDFILAESRRLKDIGDPQPAIALHVHMRHITNAACKRRDVRAALLCDQLGYWLRMAGDYSSALYFYLQAVAIFSDVRGEQHPATATSHNNLGILLIEQGDYAGARARFEHALAIFNATLPANHPRTVATLNNYATLLQAHFQTQDDFAAARLCFQQALTIRWGDLGENHPDTATSLNNLGILLQTQGALSTARSYLDQTLAIYREVLGENHAHNSFILNSLGGLLRAQGDFSAARLCFEQALTICRESVGENHPNTAFSLNNLGLLLRDQGDLLAARSCFEQALAICQEILNPNHPYISDIQDNLVSLGAI